MFNFYSRIIPLVTIIAVSPEYNIVNAQNIFDYTHTLEYAGHLTNAQNHKLAFREYERLSFYDPQNDSVVYCLLNSSLLSGQYNRGRMRAEHLYDSTRMFPLFVALEYSKLLILSNNSPKFDSLLKSKVFAESGYEMQIRLYDCMWRGKWKDAGSILAVVSKDNSAEKSASQSLVNQALSFRKKSPFLATVFSIVPGGGKLYTRNFSDGLLSFIVVGVNTFFAYRGFIKKDIESIPGWFFGAMGSGFYISNFYGGYKSAKKYNSDFYESLHKDVENIIINSNF